MKLKIAYSVVVVIMIDETIMRIIFVTILPCILYLIFDSLWINE